MVEGLSDKLQSREAMLSELTKPTRTEAAEVARVAGDEAVERARLQTDANTYTWRGTEDQQHAERMKACRERMAQYPADECDNDGSCPECMHDMAEALETPQSKERRAKARAALSASIPTGAGEVWPKSIGRLHLSERVSDGERLCSWNHDVPAGHPLYWPQAISQYDDSDPCCLEHAIEQYVSEAGYGDSAASSHRLAHTTAEPTEREKGDA